jgi:hypothetical protein
VLRLPCWGQDKYSVTLDSLTLHTHHPPHGIIALAMALDRAEWRPEPAKLVGWL